MANPIDLQVSNIQPVPPQHHRAGKPIKDIHIPRSRQTCDRKTIVIHKCQCKGGKLGGLQLGTISKPNGQRGSLQQQQVVRSSKTRIMCFLALFTACYYL